MLLFSLAGCSGTTPANKSAVALHTPEDDLVTTDTASLTSTVGRASDLVSPYLPSCEPPEFTLAGTNADGTVVYKLKKREDTEQDE